MNNEMPDNNESTCMNSVSIKENADEDDTVPFWSDNPNILFNSKYIFEFFPTENMTYEQKLNCISRLIIVLTAIGFVFTKNIRLLMVAVITLGSIFLMHLYQMREKTNKKSKHVSFAENFDTNTIAGKTLTDANVNIPTDVFDKPTSRNLMSNVLMSDYDYNPNKKPAPPSYNENINTDILGQAKQFVADANPGQPDIANKLFKDLGDEFMFEQSLRPFVSNPATTIPNDQQAFVEFCYGGMVSSKEGNLFSLARNLQRHTN